MPSWLTWCSRRRRRCSPCCLKVRPGPRGGRGVAGHVCSPAGLEQQARFTSTEVCKRSAGLQWWHAASMSAHPSHDHHHTPTTHPQSLSLSHPPRLPCPREQALTLPHHSLHVQPAAHAQARASRVLPSSPACVRSARILCAYGRAAAAWAASSASLPLPASRCPLPCPLLALLPA